MNPRPLYRSLIASSALFFSGLGAIALVPQVFVLPTFAQETVERKPTPLGVRQQAVERMMDDLESKFKTLAQTLSKTEPQRAEKLIKTLNEAKSLGVQARMSAITKLLDESQLDSATNEQTTILKDVRKLLELLLDEDKKDPLEEAKRLEELKRNLEEIIKDERNQETDTNKLANKDETLDKLGKQIAAVQKLIEKQQEIVKQTGEARVKGAQALGPIAEAQRGVREATQKVADDINGKPSEDAAGEGKPGEGKPGEGKPGEGKPGEGKPGEGKPGEGKPGEG
ncbi:MAG TPA: hypothetical protein VL096_01920, partial [Pirellulaceae bacterium]|nr:hypothetical protein [Pirellulaceae bacterium]